MTAGQYYDYGISEDAPGNPLRSAPSVELKPATEGSNWGKIGAGSSEGEEYDGKEGVEETLDSSKEPRDQPVVFKMGRRVDGYAQISEWMNPAVATVKAGWVGLVRSPRRREMLERYGRVLGVAVVTLSAVLVGWWIRGIGRVPEGFVERGSPQWFRSRLHHGRGGCDAG